MHAVRPEMGYRWLDPIDCEQGGMPIRIRNPVWQTRPESGWIFSIIFRINQAWPCCDASCYGCRLPKHCDIAESGETSKKSEKEETVDEKATEEVAEKANEEQAADEDTKANGGRFLKKGRLKLFADLYEVNETRLKLIEDYGFHS